MPIITTTALRNYNAQGFINSFNPGSNVLFFTEGQTLAWPYEPTPNTPIDTINQTKLIWDNMIFAKLVTLNNMNLVVNRNNWVSNTVYTAYTDTNPTLYQSQFYIITANSEVYKCLSNNNGANSTVQPFGLGNLSNNYIQTTSDGYQWKYMLQVATNDIFFNAQWFSTPVIAPNGSTQAIIEAAAVPGSIDVINIISGGQNYANNPQSFIVTITGDGTNANAYANVVGGSIQNIVMVNRGQNYSYANVTFTDPIGTGAQGIVVMPPPGGHGSDANEELAATSVMISVLSSNSEAGFLTTNNSFRQISLLVNPLQFGSTTVCANTRARPYTTLVVSGGISGYSINETVYQGSGINNATFTGAIIDFNAVTGVLEVNNITGVPLTGSILYGLSSGAQRYITQITNPDLQKYTGTFLEIDNEPPIARQASQQEQLQYIVNF